MAQAGLIWRRGLAATAACVLLCGCADTELDGYTGQLAPVRVFPGSLLLPAPGPPRGPLRDTCGAAALAGLVGRPRTQIPVPVDLTHRRVACTACPVAPDVQLDRVNILYDAQTGLVTKITCG